MQIEIFDNLTVPTVSSTYTKVARAQSCANYVQHIERLSRAICPAACHVVRRHSSTENLPLGWIRNLSGEKHRAIEVNRFVSTVAYFEG